MSASISPQELFDKLKGRETLHLVDIRSKDEYTTWHIYRSINIPFNQLSQKTNLLKKEKEIVIICPNGVSSKKAAKILKNKGYMARYLKGGLFQWNKIFDIVKVVPIIHSPLDIYQAKRLGKGCLSYIIISKRDKQAVIVDPARHIKPYLNFIAEKGTSLAAVLDTHIHADHISGGKKLSQRQKVPYLLPEKSEVKFKFKSIEKFLAKILKEEMIQVFATPGHTPESVSIALDKSFCLTGDTLFLESVGRSDLGENTEKAAEQLFSTIRKKLFDLEDDTFILPAHTEQPMTPGPVIAATLRYVKRVNFVAKIRSEDKFVKKLLQEVPPPPESFKVIKEMNIKGRKKRGVNLDELELGDNRCAV